MDIDIDLAKPFKSAWSELKDGADEALAILIVAAFLYGCISRLGR
jgi:hypothetical protein